MAKAKSKPRTRKRKSAAAAKPARPLLSRTRHPWQVDPALVAARVAAEAASAAAQEEPGESDAAGQ
jgi:hypothetical protein